MTAIVGATGDVVEGVDVAKRVVLGTAGHVDHGKTSLVKALTGIDTDRLAEEKRRGITIELGFAHLDLPDGTVAGVVDVPGHERFVRAMAAGAFGLDIVLLVVALDEGVMPQTREHLDICRLLGVRRGLVALTKSDLAATLGEEYVDLAREDLAEVLRGTFLEKAPVLAVSARSGEGIDALKQAIAALTAEVDERPVDGPPYLPLDRAFTVKGFGTVVTGTLFAGSLHSDELVDLIPGGPKGVRVRGVQSYGQPATEVLAGMRSAVNLVGVETAEIERGMVLVAQGTVGETSILDVDLELLPNVAKALRTRSKVLLHLGTGIAEATITLLDRATLEPGDRAAVQLTLGSPVAALAGQRFIVRGFAAQAGRGSTLGGGVILDPSPRRHRHKKAEAAAALQVLREGAPEAQVLALVRESGYRGARLSAVTQRLGLGPKVADKALSALATRGQVVIFDKAERELVAQEHLQALRLRAKRLLAEQAEANPLSRSLPREALRARLGDAVSPKLLSRVIDELVAQKEAEIDGEGVRQPGGRAAPAGSSANRLVEQVFGALEKAALGPPRVSELATQLGTEPKHVLEALRHLKTEGRAVRVLDDMYFAAAAIADLRTRMVDHLRAHREMDIQAFKDLVGQTRKWTVPLGEYFDNERITLRVGDKRVLRGGGA